MASVFKRLASIYNKGDCAWEVLCENSRENKFDEVFSNTIAGTVTSSKLTTIRLGQSSHLVHLLS